MRVLLVSPFFFGLKFIYSVLGGFLELEMNFGNFENSLKQLSKVICIFLFFRSFSIFQLYYSKRIFLT